MGEKINFIHQEGLLFVYSITGFASALSFERFEAIVAIWQNIGFETNHSQKFNVFLSLNYEINYRTCGYVFNGVYFTQAQRQFQLASMSSMRYQGKLRHGEILRSW